VRLAQENSFEAIHQQWLAHRTLELQDGRQSTLAPMQRIFGKDVLTPRWTGSPSSRSNGLICWKFSRRYGTLTTAEKVRTLAGSTVSLCAGRRGWPGSFYRHVLRARCPETRTMQMHVRRDCRHSPARARTRRSHTPGLRRCTGTGARGSPSLGRERCPSPVCSRPNGPAS
jgi:hypothetical protein